jgi:hypothetical protein
MWQLLPVVFPGLTLWLTRLAWIAAGATVLLWKMWVLIIPLGLLYLLMRVRTRREKR